MTGLIGLVTIALVIGLTRKYGRDGRPVHPPFTDVRLPPLERALRKAKRAAIADLEPGGFVAVVGRIVEPVELVAPLSRRPCAACDVFLEEMRTATPVTRQVRGSVFVIDDGSGRAVVDARGAFVRVRHDHRAPAIRAPSELVETAATVNGYEGALVPGMSVLVIGVASRADDAADPSYRRLADARIHLSGGGAQSAVVSNLREDLAHYR